MLDILLYYVFIVCWKIKQWIFSLSFFHRGSLIKQVNTLQYIVTHSLDICNFPAAKGSLRQRQLQCFSVLQRIDIVCKQHNLSYWLDFGTLLGAVRHKGFVPWDDDVDISMPREDYLKIIPYLKQTFKGSDFIVREKIDVYFQVRIQNRDNSIGIDIFPIGEIKYEDSLSDKMLVKINRNLQRARKRFHSYIYWRYKNKLTKTNAPHDLVKIRDKAVTLEKQFLYQADLKLGTGARKLLYYGIDFPHDSDNFHPVEYETIFPLKEAEFEGKKYFVPNNTDRYLKDLYGNYMTFPTNINIAK